MDVPKVVKGVDSVTREDNWTLSWVSEKTGDNHVAQFTHEHDADLFQCAIELALGIGNVFSVFEKRSSDDPTQR